MSDTKNFKQKKISDKFSKPTTKQFNKFFKPWGQKKIGKRPVNFINKFSRPNLLDKSNDNFWVGKKKFTFDPKFGLCLWIRQTYNNIFLTVTSVRGKVRFVISGGFSKLRGNNRASHRSVEIITKMLIRKLNRIRIKRLEFKTLAIFLTTPKNSITKSLLNLLSFVPKVNFIASRLRIPHNGIRLKKLRRL